MSLSPALPTLEFYHRDGCHLCDDARLALQQVLEDRVKRGDPIPRVHEVNLTHQPELEPRYGMLIPVLALGDQELALVTSARTIAEFLDRVLGRLA
jgi:hypothetical protein